MEISSEGDPTPTLCLRISGPKKYKLKHYLVDSNFVPVREKHSALFFSKASDSPDRACGRDFNRLDNRLAFGCLECVHKTPGNMRESYLCDKGGKYKWIGMSSPWAMDSISYIWGVLYPSWCSWGTSKSLQIDYRRDHYQHGHSRIFSRTQVRNCFLKLPLNDLHIVLLLLMWYFCSVLTDTS